MSLAFHKMHGAGNDFVLIDLRQQAFELDPGIARALAERRTGIGCDQLLILRNPLNEASLVSFEVWNSDGSRAEQCGNGVRCIGLYLHQRGESPPGEFIIDGPVGSIALEIVGDGQVRAAMGNPVFNPSNIPVDAKGDHHWYKIQLSQGLVDLGAVSIGNPHALMVVDDFDAVSIPDLGQEISTHPAFPQGCNAGFARVLDRQTIELRVFERGAGETLACGSGACAAAALLIDAGKLDRKVLVKQAGGELMVEWMYKDVCLFQTGPAVHLYEGNLL